jgi:hypothetical protein
MIFYVDIYMTSQEFDISFTNLKQKFSIPEHCFIDAKAALELNCSICSHIFFEPSMLYNARDDPCSHSFCNACIMQWLDTKKCCPLCRHPTRQKHVIPDVRLRRQIAVLKVHCCNTGCLWTGNLGKNGQDYFAHIGVCEFQVHDCELCNEVYIGQYDKHNAVCIETNISCPMKCREEIKRRDLEKHMLESCDRRLVDCAFIRFGCKDVICAEDVPYHEMRERSKHLSIMTTYVDSIEKQVDEFKSRKRKTLSPLALV